MKQHIAFMLAALLCVGLTGCNQKTNDRENIKNSISNEQFGNKEKDLNTPTVEIVDHHGTHIGSIFQNTGTTLTNNGIFYSTVYSENVSTDTISTEITDGNKETVTYHLYDLQTNNDYVLGSIPDQDYEAGYSRTELNGKLYTLITTGNALDQIPDPLFLAEFDLITHTVNQFRVSNNGFPYTAMTSVNGKLLIVNHDQTDKLDDILYLFEPDNSETKEVLRFELKDDSGDTIRQMYSDGENVYLLRLRFENKSVKMFLDTYDNDFNKLSERDISSFLEKGSDNSLVSDDIENEMKQMVSKFMVLDKRFVYYENFSISRFFGNLENGEILEETKGVGDQFLAASGSGNPFFYYAFGGGKNENAVFELKNNSLSKSFFKADDTRYYITAASINQNGNRLIQVDYINPDDGNDTLPTKLYYI